MKRIAGTLVALVLLAGCGGGGEEQSADVPPYKVVSNADATITVEVESTNGLNRVFEDAIKDIETDGGWSVLINCSTGATKGSDNRLANGRYAVGNIGAARTGLDDGETAFKVNQDRTCPKPEPAAEGCASQGDVDETVGEMLERCEGREDSRDEWTKAPDSEQGAAYLDELAAIHPELGDERTLAWGAYTCRDIREGQTGDRVLTTVKGRYAGGTRPPLSDGQAQTILEAITTHICPELDP